MNKKLTTKNFYNKKYECKIYVNYNKIIYKIFINSLIKKINLPKGSFILDAGCGNGFFSKLLNDYGMNVIGVDISEKGIVLAKNLYPNVLFIIGDILELPFNKKFDSIFIRSCSLYNNENFKNNSEVTDTLIKWINKNGIFIFVYNTKMKSKDKNYSWIYHSYADAKDHFKKYKSNIYFINRLDTLIFRKYAFNSLFTKLNIFISRITGLGGELVSIIRMN